jgi:hydroxymethylglutaryl-CoA reductase (NADPH)
MDVPGFLVRQFYVKGSLRNSERGFELQARNPMGDGALVGVGRLAIDGQSIPAGSVRALREGDDAPIQASEVSPQRPIRVRQGDRVTLLVDGPRLERGEHRLEVELDELNLGRLRFSVRDRLSGD